MHREPVLEPEDIDSRPWIQNPGKASFSKSLYLYTALALWQSELCVVEITKGLFPTGINKVSHCHYYPHSHTGNGTPNPSNGGVVRYAPSYTGTQSLKLAAPARRPLVVP